MDHYSIADYSNPSHRASSQAAMSVRCKLRTKNSADGGLFCIWSRLALNKEPALVAHLDVGLQICSILYIAC
jgi:hypothetical protein